MATTLRDIYADFIIVLDDCEQLGSTETYLGILVTFKQDIEERIKTCIDTHMRNEILNHKSN